MIKTGKANTKTTLKGQLKKMRQFLPMAPCASPHSTDVWSDRESLRGNTVTLLCVGRGKYGGRRVRAPGRNSQSLAGGPDLIKGGMGAWDLEENRSIVRRRGPLTNKASSSSSSLTGYKH